MLHITADANIPFVQEAFGALGTVRTLPGRDITADALAETDVLLVRSVTRVDAALLDGTPVRWVGTATAGTDHIDADALRQRGVAFAGAPGSNATSVADWVLAGLLAVAADRGEGLMGRRLGIVGMGAVGGRLATRARALGLEVIGCDPPLQVQRTQGFVSLAEVLAQSDVVTLHTPLSGPDESAWPTRGLIDLGAAAAMRPDAWLVNAARGGVVTADAALALARTRPVLLDVWPGEPDPSPELVDAVAIATPHVAGYAWDGKVRGTRMLADALRQWARGDGLDAPDWRPELDPPAPVDAPDMMFDPNLADSPPPGQGELEGVDPAEHDAPHPPPLSPPVQEGDSLSEPGSSMSGPERPYPHPIPAASGTAWLDALARRAYDVRADDARFRAALADAPDRAGAFAGLRRTYPQRRELSRYSVVGSVPDSLRTAVADGLGFSL